MPKFNVGVYRTQTFYHTIEAEDEEDAALQMTSDSDLVEEMMHDWPEKVDHGYWQIDFVEDPD